jgi:hypothetical protein
LRFFGHLLSSFSGIAIYALHSAFIMTDTSNWAEATTIYKSLYKTLVEGTTPKLSQDHLFKVHATVSLIPIKLNNGTYKILSTSPRLESPNLRPCYVLMSHGFLSHKYSLIPDRNSPAVVRPLAIYTTISKYLSHASISDLSMLQDEHSALTAALCSPSQGSETSSIRPDWALECPSSLRVAYFKDTTPYAHLELRIGSKYTFRWKYCEYPADSGEYVYIMHRRTGSAEWSTPVACIMEASIPSPVDGSKLWAIEVDTRKVSPVIAFLSCFAGRTIRRGSYLATAVLARPLRLPKPLYNHVFEDDLETPIQDTLVSTDKSDEDSDTDQSISFYQPPTIIKVFNGAVLQTLVIPPEMMRILNLQSMHYINAIKSMYK